MLPRRPRPTTKARKMYCREWTRVKYGKEERVAAPLKCKRWQCPNCEPDRLRALQMLARAERRRAS
jgi:hypothetical protein